jgi:hypothetical protein
MECDLNHGLDQPQSPSNPGFHAIHFAAISFVIVPQQVQNSVKHQNAQFVIEVPAMATRIRPRDGG